jgi:hypothetical protein
MVILTVTSKGLQQALQLPVDSNISIWCGSEALSSSDFKALNRSGLTRFSYPIAEQAASDLSVELDVIKLHHPEEVIYVEHLPSSFSESI